MRRSWNNEVSDAEVRCVRRKVGLDSHGSQMGREVVGVGAEPSTLMVGV